RLIAVSKATAEDLVRFYHVPGGRVAVVHSGVDPRMRPQDPARVAHVMHRLGIAGPYFLYVGRNHPRKNLSMLRRAFDEARRRGLRVNLVLAGPDHDAAPASDVVTTLAYVSPDDLPALYAGAVALTLPSRFEGFGFPALEGVGGGARGPGVGGRPASTGRHLAIAPLAVPEKAAQVGRQRLVILRRRKEGGVPGDFRDGTGVGGDHRGACGERLQHRQTEPLIQ